MTDDRERGGFASRLPEDPAYWDALATRITDSAEPVFAELAERQAQAWWKPLDRFGPAVATGAIAAAAAIFLLLPGAEPAVVAAPASPTDLVENAFTTPQPPDVLALMVMGNEEQR